MNTPKLSLDLDDLNVDSFSTGAASAQLQQSDVIYTVAGPTLNVRASCGGTCGGSCYTCEVDCWM
jgi:hypothetical protein